MVKGPESALLSALPYAGMAAVATVDVTAGPEGGLLPLVAIGPAFAGLVGGWRRTAFIGVLALIICFGLGMHSHSFDERRGYIALVSVAVVTAAGLAAAVRRQRREAELASVRSIAEVAQRVLLRPVPGSAGHLRVAVSYTSAVAEARIGGDLYEVVSFPGGVRLIVGDVQGKGLEAVETVAVVLGAFREAAHDEPDLICVGGRLERAADRELQDEKFVTAILAEATDGGVTFLNYGHPAPLLVRVDGTAQFVEPPHYALPLGLGVHGVDGPQPFTVDFAPGDQLLLYTDGVSEARNEEHVFYPLHERTRFLKDDDPKAALEALRRDLLQHAGGGPLHDDAAMLLIRHRTEKNDRDSAGDVENPRPAPSR